MNNIFDILEVCLQELDNGVELETVLAHYPKMAAELRPMLQAAHTAKFAAIPAPQANIMSRSQAKVLQRYDQVFVSKPVTRNWLFSSQRLITALVLLVLIFVSTISTVRASFNSLPGDGLYPVKRSWEQVNLFLSTTEDTREKLEIQYEQERLNELDQLFGSGRSAHVEFIGVVHLQQGEKWQVANISVIVSAHTSLPDQTIQNGDLVRVIGTTSSGSVVIAERIELITAGTPEPVGTEVPSETETVRPEVTSLPETQDTSSKSETETPGPRVSPTVPPTATPKIESLDGVLTATDKSIWIVDTIFIDTSNAEITGVPLVGATVVAEGYFGSDGVFVAKKIEIINNNANSGNTNSNNNGNANDDSGGGGGGGGGKGGSGNDNGGGGNGNGG